MREIAKIRVRYGYRKIRVLLNREGWNVSRYLAYRLYQEKGLVLRSRHRRRRRAEKDFVARLRISCWGWISSPFSWYMGGAFEA
jgi:putative transposase